MTFGNVMHTLGVIVVTVIILGIIGASVHHGATGGYAVGYGIGAVITFIAQAVSTI